jgi:Tfp pilus assembly protein PilF
MYDHAWLDAEKYALKAMEINPGLAVAHHARAVQLAVRGRGVEALPEIEKAAALDPLTSLFQAHHGWILHILNRDKEALQIVLSAMEMHPHDYYVMRIVLNTCRAGGRPDLGISIGEKAASLTGNKSTAMAIRAFGHAQAGDNATAASILKEIENDPAASAASGYFRALAYVTIGDLERAMDFLEATFEAAMGISVIFNAETIFEPLRGLPRFQALMARLKLM